MKSMYCWVRPLWMGSPAPPSSCFGTGTQIQGTCQCQSAMQNCARWQRAKLAVQTSPTNRASARRRAKCRTPSLQWNNLLRWNYVAVKLETSKNCSETPWQQLQWNLVLALALALAFAPLRIWVTTQLPHQRLRKKLGNPKSAADSSSKRSSSSSRAADGRLACDINTRHLLPAARRAWSCSTSCRRERWSSTKMAAPTRQTSSALDVAQPVSDGLSRAGSEVNFRLTTWMNLKARVNSVSRSRASRSTLDWVAGADAKEQMPRS